MPPVRTTTIPASQVPGDVIPGDVSTSEAGVLPDAGGDLPGRTPVGYEVPAGQRATTPAPTKPLSKSEADNYLASRRAKQNPDTAPTMSTDEANQYLQARRAQQSAVTPPQASIETPTQETAPQSAAKENYPQGVGLATLFHDLPPSLQQLIRDHPYMTGAIAAGAIPLAALIPEGAAAAAGGLALRHLIWPAVGAAATGAGFGSAFDYFTGGHIMPKLIHMIGQLGEE